MILDLAVEQDEFFIGVLVILILGLILKLRKINQRAKTLEKENIKLLADTALLEAEYLKFQLQPHTLNNILANLKLIASKLNKGLYSLSETLEYILYKGNLHLVSVKDELDFIKEYLILNELFITEIDSIKTDFIELNESSKYYNTPCIPHLISAYFIENAFKHGDITHKDFLKIKIILSDKEFVLEVTNKIKNKANIKSGGIGLKNMGKRLELLSVSEFKFEHNPVDNEYYSYLKIHFT